MITMDATEYDRWIAAHILMTGFTGSNAERLRELLEANRAIIVGSWKATYDELGECTEQLVRKGLVPAWPNEHTNALHRELMALRATRWRERQIIEDRQAMADRLHRPLPSGDPCDCPACNGGRETPKYAMAFKKLGELVGRDKKKPRRKARQ